MSTSALRACLHTRPSRTSSSVRLNPTSGPTIRVGVRPRGSTGIVFEGGRMTITPDKLDEIERLAELATPGPWYYAGCNTAHDANHDEVAHPCDMGNDCA